MKKVIEILIWLGFFLVSQGLFAQQNLTQNIRGTVIDKESQAPLIGAEVAVLSTVELIGNVTDLVGDFKIEDLPIGRHTIQVTYLGYEPLVLNNLLLTSGKELVLNVELTESAVTLGVATVTAELDKNETLNEMATVSARSFSVEETARYAGSFYDPARMASNYAGVNMGSSDDLSNEIVIRGNSPRGVLWRLEGIEIPNPNHFGSMGASGGGISMLSSSTLSNSDFYTGAFPAEFGNALSGVFDLNMRNGNNQQREYALMLGALGFEVAAEGPFKNGGRGSYLVNYRYSTLALLDAAGLSPAGDVTPLYSDLSFKLNMPTEKAGNFALFGLAGQNTVSFSPETDSSKWEGSEFDEWGFDETQRMGTLGLSHRILLNDNSYLRTIAMASTETVLEEDYWLDEENDYQRTDDFKNDATNNAVRFSTLYNQKINAKNTFRSGLIFSYLSFNFKLYDDDNFDDGKGENQILLFDNSGKTSFLQAYSQWKHRFNEKWTLNTGLHYSHMTLNHEFAIEPRAALQWKLDQRQSLSASVGLHSKMEHLATYLFEGTLPGGTIRTANDDLALSKAFHAVLGYDCRLGENLRLKTELYYQYLYDLPVEDIEGSTNSIVNAFDIWDIIGAEQVNNEGTGQNYGLDLTLEKFFSDDYYFLVTGSIYESLYSPIDGKKYPTRFDGRYSATLLGGKEFRVGKNKKNILGFNGKFILAGGNRYTPIDLEASIRDGEQVEFEDRPFDAKAGDYARFDLGVSYRINRNNLTHTIMLDIQNATNRENLHSLYYDDDTQQLDRYTQTGLFPIFNYRVEF